MDSSESLSGAALPLSHSDVIAVAALIYVGLHVVKLLRSAAQRRAKKE